MPSINNSSMPLADLTSNQSGAIRAVRTSTGSVGLGATVDVTVTWPTAFVDDNYTALVTVEEPTADITNDNLFLRKIVSKTASGMVVSVGLVFSTTPSVARTGTLHCIAIHD